MPRRIVLTGFHAIEEKIRGAAASSGAEGLRLVYASPAGPRAREILAEARRAGVAAFAADRRELDSLAASLPEALRDHRGLVLVAEGASAGTDLDSFLRALGARPARVVLLDSITDPYNAGAIIRSCDQFGVSLVVASRHKSVGDLCANETVSRASAGAAAWVPVCTAGNLVQAAEKLKDAGFWLYGADSAGEPVRGVAFAERSALVLGSEGRGISRLLAEQCDALCAVPTCGRLDSLNVSVAAGILLYEMTRPGGHGVRR